MKKKIIDVLLYLLGKCGYKPEVKPEVLQGINRQDIDLLQKAFVPYTYKHGTSAENIALNLSRSDGEQRVIQYIVSRVQGRIGAIHD